MPTPPPTFLATLTPAGAPITQQAPDVFTAGLALLAFIMALFTLAAREQKAPYITNSIYTTALIVLTAICLSFASKLSGITWLATGAVGLLVAGLANVYRQVWHARNRRFNLRDDNSIKNMRLIRIARNWRRLGRGPTYEHNPLKFDAALVESLLKSPGLPAEALRAAVARREANDTLSFSLSISAKVETLTNADRLLGDLAARFLSANCWVQYTTCARHPIEFISELKTVCNNWTPSLDWRSVADRIVVVDAYTPHFGFSDSIHDAATHRTKDMGVACIRSTASYAGVHTGAAKAFNVIKKRSKGKARQPALVIYEAPHALVELESIEQYRIFIRHLFPSERLWGAMLTLVIESGVPEGDLSLLKSYTDIFVDQCAPDSALREHQRPSGV